MENLKKKEVDDLLLFDGSPRLTATLIMITVCHAGRKMAASNFENFVYIITPSTITLSCRMNVYIVCHIQRQILITRNISCDPCTVTKC